MSLNVRPHSRERLYVNSKNKRPRRQSFGNNQDVSLSRKLAAERGRLGVMLVQQGHAVVAPAPVIFYSSNDPQT